MVRCWFAGFRLTAWYRFSPATAEVPAGRRD